MNVSVTTISSAEADSAVIGQSHPAQEYAIRVDEYLRTCRDCSRELVVAVRKQISDAHFDIEVPSVGISEETLVLSKPGEVVTWFVGDRSDLAVLQQSPAGQRAHQWVKNCNRHLEWCRYRYAQLVAESGWKK